MTGRNVLGFTHAAARHDGSQNDTEAALCIHTMGISGSRPVTQILLCDLLVDEQGRSGPVIDFNVNPLIQ